MTTSLVVLVAVIVGGGYVAWRWSQEQYYVGADSKGEVVIYRGVNQRIAGISLSKPYKLTGIELAQVPAPYAETVKATDAASSLGNAQAIVSQRPHRGHRVPAAVHRAAGLGDQGERLPGRGGAGQLARQAKKPAPSVPPTQARRRPRPRRRARLPPRSASRPVPWSPPQDTRE